MRSWRENPDSPECTAAAKQIEREIGALKLQAQSEEIACPNCYGGHFRPCQWCGDTGRVTNIPNAKPSNIGVGTGLQIIEREIKPG